MSPRYLPIVSIAIAAAIGFALLSRCSNAPPSGDEWRRTASGWERKNDWPISAVVSSGNVPSIAKSRIDSHPAALVLVQLVGTLLSLYAFPRGTQVPGGWKSWTAILKRSFRASAFGC